MNDHNNPVSNTDPQGTLWVGFVETGVGIVVGAATNFVAQVLQDGGNWSCVSWEKCVQLDLYQTCTKNTGCCWNAANASGIPHKRKKDPKVLFSFSMEFSGTPWNNNWSGKRDSHLVSDPLKSKGFLFLPKQEKTQFWTCFQGVSRAKKESIQATLLEPTYSQLTIFCDYNASFELGVIEIGSMAHARRKFLDL